MLYQLSYSRYFLELKVGHDPTTCCLQDSCSAYLSYFSLFGILAWIRTRNSQDQSLVTSPLVYEDMSGSPGRI